MKSIYGYKVTLAQFFDFGHELVSGDEYLNYANCKVVVGVDVSKRDANRRDGCEGGRYIFKAAAFSPNCVGPLR